METFDAPELDLNVKVSVDRTVFLECSDTQSRSFVGCGIGDTVIQTL